jgi:hypothetical protein
VCGANNTCFCGQSDADACAAAGIECGPTTNICGQAVTCYCPVGNLTCLNGTCVSICVTGTGGPILAGPSAACPAN